MAESEEVARFEEAPNAGPKTAADLLDLAATRLGPGVPPSLSPPTPWAGPLPGTFVRTTRPSQRTTPWSQTVAYVSDPNGVLVKIGDEVPASPPPSYLNRCTAAWYPPFAERRGPVDLETLLVALYVLVEEWWEENRPRARRGPGPPLSFSDAEVLTLANLAKWPRFRSERDFWRFADAHLRRYFPALLSQSQLNRRVRALEPELRALQRRLSVALADGSEVYHVLDTTLIPAIVRVRACRKGLFAGQATFGRNVSKTE